MEGFEILISSVPTSKLSGLLNCINLPSLNMTDLIVHISHVISPLRKLGGHLTVSNTALPVHHHPVGGAVSHVVDAVGSLVDLATDCVNGFQRVQVVDQSVVVGDPVWHVICVIYPITGGLWLVFALVFDVLDVLTHHVPEVLADCRRVRVSVHL